jgi:hypothetical protein
MLAFVSPMNVLTPFVLADDNELTGRRSNVGVRRRLIHRNGIVVQRRIYRVGDYMRDRRYIHSIDCT